MRSQAYWNAMKKIEDYLNFYVYKIGKKGCDLMNCNIALVEKIF